MVVHVPENMDEYANIQRQNVRWHIRQIEWTREFRWAIANFAFIRHSIDERMRSPGTPCRML